MEGCRFADRSCGLNTFSAKGWRSSRSAGTAQAHLCLLNGTDFARQQISSCFPKWLVQPLLQKYFAFGPRQISSLIRTVSSQGGVIARRHERGAGCGGRGSVRRCQGMAGRVDKAREPTNGTQTNDAFRGRQSRVVLAPVAGVKFAEASRPDRAWYKPLIRG